MSASAASSSRAAIRLPLSAARAAGEVLDGEGDFAQASGTFPSGAHIAVVEVDTETGKTVLRELVAVDDAG
ncbi:MAG: molybdopterin cofactor-binding domain-containing protein, partial [Actinomycetota bacterium]